MGLAIGSGRSFARLDEIASAAERSAQAKTVSDFGHLTFDVATSQPYGKPVSSLADLTAIDGVISGKEPVAVYLVSGSTQGILGVGAGREVRRRLPVYLDVSSDSATGHGRSSTPLQFAELSDAREGAQALSLSLTTKWNAQASGAHMPEVPPGVSVSTAVVNTGLPETPFLVRPLVMKTPNGSWWIPYEQPFNPFRGPGSPHPDSLGAQLIKTDQRLVAVHGAQRGADLTAADALVFHKDVSL